MKNQTVKSGPKMCPAASRATAPRGSWRQRVRGRRRAPEFPPLRCPPELISLSLPRLPAGQLFAECGLEWLRHGQAFVVPARELLGDLLKWDMAHLRAHLPPGDHP